jgi:REP element-mobilizing transposase RayT
MARHPRIHAPGVLYHLMARGNNGQAVYLSRGDYEAFLEALQTVRARYPFSLYAYVLMPNHFHLLVEAQEEPTSRWMQALLTKHARRFNRVHGRRGHVFEGRYKAIVCERETYLLELVRYIHLNPVRAGLVKEPGAWKWSGHGEYMGMAKRGLIDPGPVRGQLRTSTRYEAFVREGLKGRYRKEWHPGDSAPFLGAEEFVQRVAKRRKPSSSRRVPPVDVLWRQAATRAGLDREALRHGGRSGRLVAVRDGFIRRAVLECGYRAATVARFLGCHPSNISRALRKG